MADEKKGEAAANAEETKVEKSGPGLKDLWPYMLAGVLLFLVLGLEVARRK